MKTVPLTQNKEALVDDEDYERIIAYGSWHYDRYAKRVQRQLPHVMYMHRIVLDAPAGLEVDHINGNRLDNRKENLRLCTRLENGKNFTKARATSGHVGVSYDKLRSKWKSTIRVNGKSIQTRFDTLEEALADRRAKEQQHFGVYAPRR